MISPSRTTRALSSAGPLIGGLCRIRYIPSSPIGSLQARFPRVAFPGPVSYQDRQEFDPLAGRRLTGLCRPGGSRLSLWMGLGGAVGFTPAATLDTRDAFGNQPILLTRFCRFAADSDGTYIAYRPTIRAAPNDSGNPRLKDLRWPGRGWRRPATGRARRRCDAGGNGSRRFRRRATRSESSDLVALLPAGPDQDIDELRLTAHILVAFGD